MRKLFFVFIASVLSITLIPGTAQASPSDTTIYPITCVSSGRVNVYLDYGINAITITNPNACHTTESLYITDGTGATWTYSQTISGTTTSGSYDPAARPNFETGALGSADAFTLTLASTSNSSLTFSNGYRTLDIFFNNQFNTLSPSPVAIGQQVTVTGNNLSSVTSLSLQSSSNNFSATTSNRTATQLTFTVPSTVTDWRGITSDVTPGIYSLNLARGKTLTVNAAPVVVLISADELARLARVAANAQREIDKGSARDAISSDFKRFINIKLEIFKQAEIKGITTENIEAVQAEITALPEHSSGDIAGILKIARKYEVVGMIASGRVTSVYSSTLIEIGLIPADSKHRAALLTAIKKLPASERSSYASIKAAIDRKTAEIQARQERFTQVRFRIESHRNG